MKKLLFFAACAALCASCTPKKPFTLAGTADSSADGQTVKVPAAWLIDRAGWKGFRCGTVGVHPRQALVLINLGRATAQEILNLARRIIDDVDQKFGIQLSMEVNIL